MYFRLCFGFGGLGLICLVWTPFAVVLNLSLPRGPRQRLGRFAILVGLRGYLRYLGWLGIYHCDLTALDRLKGEGPLIIAPNHPGLLDAVMILSRLPTVTCIIKASLFDSVFFGAPARMAGYIRNDSLIGVVKDATLALKSGSQLLMFPEGTRTVTPPLDPLRGGLALTACRTGIPVQVVLIEADSGFLGKGWSFFGGTRFPVRYRVRLGERFAPPKEATSFLPQLERSMRESLGGSGDTLGASIEPRGDAPPNA